MIVEKMRINRKDESFANIILILIISDILISQHNTICIYIYIYKQETSALKKSKVSKSIFL